MQIGSKHQDGVAASILRSILFISRFQLKNE